MTPSQCLLLPTAVAQRLDELVSQFHDRVALGGLRVVRAAPDPRSPADHASACAAAGHAALIAYARRLNAAQISDLDAAALVLGVVPRVLCMAIASGGGAVDATTAGAAPAVPTPVDVATFAATLLGHSPLSRLDVRPELLPAAWQAFLQAVERATAHLGSRRAGAARAAVARLAVVALANGVRTPAELAPDVCLQTWAREAGWRGRAARDWRRALRDAVSNLRRGVAAPVAGGPAVATGDVANLDVALPAGEWGGLEVRAPRTLQATLEAAGRAVPDLDDAVDDALATGRAGGVPALTPAAKFARRLRLGRAETRMLLLIERLAPLFVPLVIAPRGAGRGRRRDAQLRRATARGLVRAVDHLLAAYVRTGHPVPLADLTPGYLLATRVPAATLRVPATQPEGHLWAAANLGRDVSAPTTSLWQLLLDEQVDASAENSPTARGRASSDAVAYTPALAKAAKDLSHAFRRAAHAATPPGSDARVALDQLGAVADDVARIAAASLGADGDVATVKSVAKLLRLVSWPQLCCVGLPLLRAQVRAMRARLSQPLRFGEAPADPALYHEWLETYVVLAVFVADPLRIKNWCHAAVGYNVLVAVDRGRGGAPICAVQTQFTGDGGTNPDASLKGKDEAYRDARGRLRYRPRVRPHHWSPAVVDFDLLWDYLEQVRAPRIRAVTGRTHVIGEMAPDGVHHPLFVAPSDPVVGLDAGPRAAPPMTDDMLRGHFARGLHWVCREALGRLLPAWSEFAETRGSEWYGLFAPHVVRALCATYWLAVRKGGVVGDALDPDVRARLCLDASRAGKPAVLGTTATQYVAELLNDHPRTLRERYVAWPPDLAARLLEPCDGWTHPRAYDRWMDLIVGAVHAIAWDEQHELPLPPGRRLEEFAAV